MGQIEDDLRAYIKKRYKVLTPFCREAGIPHSTLSTILNRSIKDANAATVLRICSTLGISADELGRGRIVPLDVYHNENGVELSGAIDQMKRRLGDSKPVIDGKPLNQREIQLFYDAIDVGLELTRQMVNRRDRD